jgi:hypothetical protein
MYRFQNCITPRAGGGGADAITGGFATSQLPQSLYSTYISERHSRGGHTHTWASSAAVNRLTAASSTSSLVRADNTEIPPPYLSLSLSLYIYIYIYI